MGGLGRPAGIAAGDAQDAVKLLEDGLDTPKTSAGKDRFGPPNKSL